ncbi:unnamed protein product [Rotaria sp. Silwood2]|nr:unnamed protein product [Rotaria sp. Silwood2]CAF2663515.1 unnamed protein product [Rotaria sp. Silwood2]CAF2898827.1 unnamed protein product [Rotaria sp. Silwood2]CAF3010183.1 unnamed protein product [Rotaria sp. Silwood2]CAF3957209.1 unnamed protein product [Rotaria sp. Silwood2]
MYLSNSDMRDNANDDHNLQTPQTNTLPITSNLPQAASPPCPALLVIDDNSNSEDSTINNTNDIPNKPLISSNAQMSHVQISTNLSPSTVDIVNNTAEQQRRRNSSIAKLLGGHPLHNQQYEEINQQILDSQSAQNVTNSSDHGTDSGIQRTRSSITRTLLMNTERTNNMTEIPTKTQVASTPPFSKDFEYLIRREPEKSDIEHAPFILQQKDSASKVCQNMNSSNKTNVQLSMQPKLKRKRSFSKPSLISPNKSTTNVPPFSLHDPFELESSAINAVPSVHHQQNEFLHFNSSKRPRHSNQQHQHQQQQHSLLINNSTTNQPSYPYDKMNMNSSVYSQFSIHHDRIPSNTCPLYSHTAKLLMPSPIEPLTSSGTEPHHNHNNNNKSATMTSIRKAKSILVQPERCDFSRQRSYSHSSNQSDAFLASSSEPSVPLKKRLLHAYNNEQRPT